MPELKHHSEVEWIREQVYDLPDVSYTTEPYQGATEVRYSWEYRIEDQLQAKGTSIIYGISPDNARRLFNKWNTCNQNWHYRLLEAEEIPA